MSKTIHHTHAFVRHCSRWRGGRFSSCVRPTATVLAQSNNGNHGVAAAVAAVAAVAAAAVVAAADQLLTQATVLFADL